MKRRRRRKCLHCRALFQPDPRNVRHQQYGSKTQCRKASKVASQHRWLIKGANKNYFRGPENVQRVQAWRQAHPGYWRTMRSETKDTLQDDLLVQTIEANEKSDLLKRSMLQDLLANQGVILIGLIAHLTGTALQEDIAETGRRWVGLGAIFSIPKEVNMSIKRVLCPAQVRRIPAQFSWIDQRLVRDKHIGLCGADALALYLFLVTVADAQGLSYYSDHSILNRLSCLDTGRLAQARTELKHLGWVAYEPPLYQVLALSALIRSPMPKSSSPKTQSPRPTLNPAHIGEMLRRALEGRHD